MASVDVGIASRAGDVRGAEVFVMLVKLICGFNV